MLKTLPKGSRMDATWIPPPTSFSGSWVLAPIAVSLAISAATSSPDVVASVSDASGAGRSGRPLPQIHGLSLSGISGREKQASVGL